MNYKVVWSTGYIGGTARVYKGLSDQPLDVSLRTAIAKAQNLPVEKIKIVSFKKVRSTTSKSFGIGTPQSSRDY